jgi:hypothetical protein
VKVNAMEVANRKLETWREPTSVVGQSASILVRMWGTAATGPCIP